MATTVITMTTDDIDGSEDAQTYRLIDPATGRTLAIDLSTKNYDKLVKALAPFLDKARAITGESAPSKASKATGQRATRQYDKAGYRKWAEAAGKWNGKRPSHELIDQYEASLSKAAA